MRSTCRREPSNFRCWRYKPLGRPPRQAIVTRFEHDRAMPNGHDKNFVRLAVTVAGFREKFGRWPEQVHIMRVCFEDLEGLFTPDDYAALMKTARLMPSDSDEFTFRAEDASGNRFDYGDRAAGDSQEEAYAWLGVEPVPGY